MTCARRPTYFQPLAPLMLLGTILITFGVLQVVTALALRIRAAGKRRGCVRLEGAVVDTESYVNVSHTYFRHIFEYAAADGTRHRVTDRVGYWEPLPTDGSIRGEVWHDPLDPGRSYVEYRRQNRVRFLGPIGVVLLAAGLAVRLGWVGGP